jgi:hypothetical protein
VPIVIAGWLAAALICAAFAPSRPRRPRFAMKVRRIALRRRASRHPQSLQRKQSRGSRATNLDDDLLRQMTE